jgi:hypothetical protein
VYICNCILAWEVMLRGRVGCVDGASPTSPAAARVCAVQVVDAIYNMWHLAGVVHGELNETNILCVRVCFTERTPPCPPLLRGPLCVPLFSEALFVCPADSSPLNRATSPHPDSLPLVCLTL